jgi:hypothetical protein
LTSARWPRAICAQRRIDEVHHHHRRSCSRSTLPGCPAIAVQPRRWRFVWPERGGAEGDLMELNGWPASPQMLRLHGASARSAQGGRTYDRIMDETP